MRGFRIIVPGAFLLASLLLSGYMTQDVFVLTPKKKANGDINSLKLSYQTGHKHKSFTALAFSKDNRFLFSSNWDHTTKIWDLATGLQSASLERPAEAKIRHDRRYLITHETNMMTSGYNSQYRWSVIDVESGEEVLMSNLAKSPDWDKTSPVWVGDILAVGHRKDADKSSYLYFIEVPSGELKKELQFDGKNVSVQYCGGDRFAIFEVDRSDQKWLHWGTLSDLSYKKGKIIPRSAYSLTSDCKYLWLIHQKPKTAPAEAEVLDAETGQSLRKGRIPYYVRKDALLPDGKHLLAMTYDDDKYVDPTTAVLWNLETGTKVATYDVRKSQKFAVSADGALVAFGEYDEINHDIWIFDTMTGKKLRTLAPLLSPKTALAMSDDGRYFAEGGADGWVHIWDIRAARVSGAWYAGHRWRNLKTGDDNPGEVQALDFSPDGKMIATAGADGLVRVWDVLSRTEKAVYKMGPVNDYGYWQAAKVFFSPDGKKLMAITDPIADPKNPALSMATVFRKEPQKGDAGVAYYQISTSAFADLAISPSRRWMAVPKWTGNKVEVYDLNSEKFNLKFTVEGFGWAPIPVFTPDEKSLVIFQDNKAGPAWVVDIASGNVTAKQDISEGYETGWPVAGNVIAVTGIDGSFKRWSVDPGLTTAEHKQWKAALLGVSSVQGHAGQITTMRTSRDGRFFITASLDGTVRFWDTKDFKEAAMFLSSGADGWVSATPDGYYMASREGTQKVAFRLGGLSYPFEQFDLRQNRPDLVLKALGYAPEELVKGYEALYHKRLKKMGISEGDLAITGLPEVDVANPPPLSVKTRKLALQVRAKSPQGALDRVNAWVNDVPVFGSAGFPIKGADPLRYEGTVSIELLPGRNRIDISVLTKSGLESLRRTFNVDLDAPAAKPDLYAVMVGVSKYTDSQFNLQYAAKDAADLAKLFKGDVKRFAKINIVSLTDQNATRGRILGARAVLMKSRPQDEVIVFVAGHGLLDDKLDYYLATSDMDFSNPARNGVSFGDLEGLFDGVPARRRVLLMDTCFSGEVDKDEAVAEKSDTSAGDKGKVRAVSGRGVKAARKVGGANLAEMLSANFADLRRTSGAVVISSAGGEEYAFESDKWNNGVFTYALISGLKTGASDADKDGAVRASELRDYVSKQVQDLTSGRQTPTGRRGNLSWDFTVY